MQTTRPSYYMEGFTNGSGCHFKEIFDQVRKDLDCELFYSELKPTSHIIFYYLATNNIPRELKTISTVLIKGLKKGCKCPSTNSQETRIL